MINMRQVSFTMPAVFVSENPHLEKVLVFGSGLLLAERAEWRDAMLDGIPYDFGIGHLVSVNQMAAHAVNTAPIYLGMRQHESLGKPVHRLPDLDDAHRAAILENGIVGERVVRCTETVECLVKTIAITPDDEELVDIALSLPHKAPPRHALSFSKSAH